MQPQEHQDENIQEPSNPTQQSWYQGMSCKSVAQKQKSHLMLICQFVCRSLPERKQMKLQQGQCLIRLIGQQNRLLQQLIATSANRSSSPAPTDRLPGCSMTTAQLVSHSLSGTKGRTTQHDNSCQDVDCLLSLLDTLLRE